MACSLQMQLFTAGKNASGIGIQPSPIHLLHRFWLTNHTLFRAICSKANKKQFFFGRVNQNTQSESQWLVNHKKFVWIVFVSCFPYTNWLFPIYFIYIFCVNENSNEIEIKRELESKRRKKIAGSHSSICVALLWPSGNDGKKQTKGAQKSHRKQSFCIMSNWFHKVGNLIVVKYCWFSSVVLCNLVFSEIFARKFSKFHKCSTLIHLICFSFKRRIKTFDIIQSNMVSCFSNEQTHFSFSQEEFRQEFMLNHRIANNKTILMCFSVMFCRLIWFSTSYVFFSQKKYVENSIPLSTVCQNQWENVSYVSEKSFKTRCFRRFHLPLAQYTSYESFSTILNLSSFRGTDSFSFISVFLRISLYTCLLPSNVQPWTLNKY